MMTLLPHNLRRFLAEDDAAISVEAVLIMPILAFFYVGSFIYYEAYRGQNVSTKAAFTIGDILSRQTRTLTSDDVDGLGDLFEYLTFSDDSAWVRVTSVQAITGGHLVNWSYATDDHDGLENADIARFASKMPNIAVNERIVLVETFHSFDPFINVGLPPRVYTNFVVTRPRFASQLPFQDLSS